MCIKLLSNMATIQVSFLQDPLGDVPWSEEEASKDVVHLDYQSFKRLVGNLLNTK